MAFRRPTQGRSAGIDYLRPSIADRMAWILTSVATNKAHTMETAYKLANKHAQQEKEEQKKIR